MKQDHHINGEQELPPLPEPYQREVYATSANTPSVRKGFEVGGYVKSPDLFTADQMHAYARAALESVEVELRSMCFNFDGMREDRNAWKAKARAAQSSQPLPVRDERALVEHVPGTLILAVDAAMVEMENIHPPLGRSECKRLILAAMQALRWSPAPQPAPEAQQGEPNIDKALNRALQRSVTILDGSQPPQPAQAVPLSDEQIDAAAHWSNDRGDFKDGVRFAERSHGIGTAKTEGGA